MLPGHAQRLVAAGAKALALESSEQNHADLRAETVAWLERRDVIFHLKSSDRGPELMALLVAAGCPARFTFPTDRVGVDCTFQAPWTVVALAQLAFFDSLEGVSFSD